MAALFPPQARDWALPPDVPLTPKAAERLAREAAQHTFDPAAASLNVDWGTTLDRRQVQRWAVALGDRLAAERGAEAAAYERGVRPAAAANAPALLVVGLDGGRVQGRDVDPDSKSRWKEDKVATVTSYLPGDGRAPEEGGREPQKLVTTHVATRGDSAAIGLLARVEAERRGLRQAAEVVVIGDCAQWIDTARDEHFARYPRVADYDHAAEHVWDAARAARGREGQDAPQSPAVAALAGGLETLLYGGRVAVVIRRLSAEAAALGPVRESDGEQHPRRVLAREVGYFERNQGHMDYPAYLKKGWPIGSGNTEAGVKQFNKRVKGTDQFWSDDGAEAILALRGLWVSQDRRWERYWLSRAAYADAA